MTSPGCTDTGSFPLPRGIVSATAATRRRAAEPGRSPIDRNYKYAVHCLSSTQTHTLAFTNISQKQLLLLGVLAVGVGELDDLGTLSCAFIVHVEVDDLSNCLSVDHGTANGEADDFAENVFCRASTFLQLAKELVVRLLGFRGPDEVRDKAQQTREWVLERISISASGRKCMHIYQGTYMRRDFLEILLNQTLNYWGNLQGAMFQGPAVLRLDVDQSAGEQ